MSAWRFWVELTGVQADLFLADGQVIQQFGLAVRFTTFPWFIRCPRGRAKATNVGAVLFPGIKGCFLRLGIEMCVKEGVVGDVPEGVGEGGVAPQLIGAFFNDLLHHF